MPSESSPPSVLGKNIAYYRKLAGFSAQDLADQATHGLTRSIIANLENGRKDDLTVQQLLSVAGTLRVPPVALLTDLKNPGADAWFQPGFQLQLPDTNEALPYASFHPSGLRERDLADWIAGLIRFPPEVMNAATEEAVTDLGLLAIYSAAFRAFRAAVDGFIAASADEANQAELAEPDSSLGDTRIGQAILDVQFSYDTLISAIDRAKDAGISINKTRELADKTLASLKISPFPTPPEIPPIF